MNNINAKKIIKALEENKDTLKAIKEHIEYIPNTGKHLNDAIFSILNCIQNIKVKIEEEKEVKIEEEKEVKIEEEKEVKIEEEKEVKIEEEKADVS